MVAGVGLCDVPQAAIIASPVPTKRRKPLPKTAGARLAGAKAAAIAFGEVSDGSQ